MRIRGVDPRDGEWEEDHARYRVYFWDTGNRQSDEHEIVDADVGEVLAWADERAAAEGESYTLYVVASNGGRPGLIRLGGVLGDPFAIGE